MKASKHDEQLLVVVKDFFNEQIPFNNVLDIKVESMNQGTVTASFYMREELLGHRSRRMLHGGVISSAIDITGGLAAFLNILENTTGKNLKAKMEMADWLSTLDLRVDFLQPAKGMHFLVKAYPLRTSKKFSVIRTELRNDRDELLAVGTSTYVSASVDLNQSEPETAP